MKWAMTSTLTLTGTINPDFGQVEVDPAVVNLSQFETFYPEKRPFFTEGVNIFAFGDSPATSHFNFFNPPQTFYSRRIGRAPQGAININAPFADIPSSTTILGAAKLTGKLGKWSIGVLDAVTDSEQARYATGGLFARQVVEPESNYFVTRETREIGSSSRIGLMVTSVDRKLPSELAGLPQHAETAGIDGYAAIPNKDWVFEWFASGSRVSGSAEAITNEQESPSRYYQRPDATSFKFDPTRTSLEGWSGKAMLSKQTGLWRPLAEVQAYSPGFETNDAGFMQRTDIISSHVVEQYINDATSEHFRQRTVWVGVWDNRNFDGDTLQRGLMIQHFATLANYWNYTSDFFYNPSSIDDRATRGGPLLRTPNAWSSDVGFGSDVRKHFYFNASAHDDGSGDGSYSRNVSVTLTAQPLPSLLLSIAPTLSRSHNFSQYVTRYVFAQLEQHSFELDTRVNWTLTPKLSFQLFAQPFVATGAYHDYHSLARARTADYIPYTGSIASPNFDFRSLRGSAVARWEFRPGSALYVVWNENRADTLGFGDFRFSRDFRGISTAPSHDVFEVKVSWWLPM